MKMKEFEFSHFDLIFYFSSLLSFVFFFILCIQAPFRREKSAKRRKMRVNSSIYHTNWITLRYNTLGPVSLIYMRSFTMKLELVGKEIEFFSASFHNLYKTFFSYLSLTQMAYIAHRNVESTFFFGFHSFMEVSVKSTIVNE